jgi:sodium pump decarboxylase gamma subunit
MLESLNVLFVGMVVVFLALILLTFIIFLIPKVIAIKGNKKVEKDTDINTRINSYTKISDEKETVISKDSLKDSSKDNEIVAVITAALQAFLSSEPGIKDKTVKILSYKRLTKEAPVWNKTGRLLQTANRTQGI